MNNQISIKSSKGFSLIEVLIAMIITLVGLLGIAALQVKAQTAEFESLQRAQALIIMADIVDRINVNRQTASCFAFTTDTVAGTPYMGVNGTAAFACSASTGAYNTLAVTALTELEDQLEGVSAQIAGADTVNVGAMIGARACISYDATTEVNGEAGSGLYTVAVSWQGMSELSTPVNNCANNTYGNEGMRRTVATTTRIADLD